MALLQIKPQPSRLFTLFIAHSWWAILLFLVFFFLFDQGMQKKIEEKKRLIEKIAKLEMNRDFLKEQNEIYVRRLKSEEDWRSLRLVLKERLHVKEKNELRISLCIPQ